MLKLTKTGIGLLTKQYRSVLKRCLIANLCILYPLTSDAQAEYISTEAGYRTQVIKSSNEGNAISFYTDANSGSIILHNTEHNLSATYDFIRLSTSNDNVGGYLELKNRTNNTTKLTPTYFTLNGSAISATGIVANAIQNSTALITSGGVYDALNYYYTFRVDEISEAAEFALFLNNEKLSNVFEA